MKLHCPKGHRFESGIAMPIPINDWVEKMEAITCPECGATHDQLMVGDPPHPGGTGK